MADTEKILNTRIINKNDSLAAWNTSELVLKTGEIALAYVETTQTNVDHEGNAVTTVVPTYLMKVGNGGKKFRELPLLHAPASDVYSWAKKTEADFTTWVKSLVDVGDIDLSAYATIEFVNTEIGKVNEAISALDERVTAIETNYATKTEAQGYADAKDDAIAEAKKAGTDAAAAVTALENGAVATNAANIAELQTASATHATKDEAKGYADAKDDAIAAAKKAGDDAQADIDAYIESNDAALNVVRQNAQKGVDDAATAQSKADEVESNLSTFQGTVASTYETKTDASAKLTEAKGYTDTKIAELLDGASDETLNSINELATAIKENDSAIEALNSVAGSKASQADLNAAVNRIAQNETDIDALQAVGSEKNTIVTVKVNGTALTPDANRAVDVEVPTGALASKDKVADADLDTTLATKINGKAEQSALNDAVGRIAQNETDIEALEGAVATKAEQSALNTLSGTVSDMDAAYKAADQAINAEVAKKVDQTAYNTKMEALDGSIAQHAEDISGLDGRVDAIETNYVKVANNKLMLGDLVIVLDCGTSAV